MAKSGQVIIALFCAAGLLSGCKDYSFLKGTAAPPPGTQGFLNELADEYRLLGDFAAGQGQNEKEASKFYNKYEKAVLGQTVAPEQVEDYELPPFAVSELVEARQMLADALGQANVPENARMLAMAQVKFDCWLSYQPYQKKEGGYIGCREAFRQAMANVDFTRAVAGATDEFPAEPRTIHFADDIVTLDQESHDVIIELADQSLLVEGTIVVLTGHAKTKVAIEDTSNNTVRRIIAVRNALSQNGVDPDLVEIRFERNGSPLDVDVELLPGAAGKNS